MDTQPNDLPAWTILVAAILLLLAAKTGTADESPTLTLQQALEEAHEKSPTVQKAKAAAAESRWHKSEALGAGFLPKVSIDANHFFNTKYEYLDLAFNGAPISFPSVYPGTTAGLKVTLPVFDGFANVERYQAASLLQLASDQELTHAEFRLD